MRAGLMEHRAEILRVTTDTDGTGYRKENLNPVHEYWCSVKPSVVREAADDRIVYATEQTFRFRRNLDIQPTDVIRFRGVLYRIIVLNDNKAQDYVEITAVERENE